MKETLILSMVYAPAVLTILMFILGVCFGSFLNVCIFRTPLGQSIAKEPSHCMSCGKRLKWYELIPLFSWIFLRGKCSGCNAKISGQYPFVEGVTGLFFAFALWFYIGCPVISAKNEYGLEGLVMSIDLKLWDLDIVNFINVVLVCALFCALLVLTFIDARTHEIPNGINIFIAVIGLVSAVIRGYEAYNKTFSFNKQLLDVILGPVVVAGVLLLILYISKGGAIGGGDVKLMAAAGLFLGCKATILALVIGCIAGAVIHVILMKVKHLGRELAMGPYLSLGIMISALWATPILNWYFGFFASAAK